MEKIALSIDMDFFVREKIGWDWGHAEVPIYMTDTVWLTRYQQIDLYEETSYKHADLDPPESLFVVLKQMGFIFTNKTVVGAGWSHKDAYDFFRRHKLDRVINLDAHHDCWDEKETSKDIDCGNWLRKLLEEKSNLKASWVQPKWFENGCSTKMAEAFYFDDLPKLKGEVSAIYMAQSPAWVPPHHDEQYQHLIWSACAMVNKVRLDYDGKIVNRKPPSKSKAQKMYYEYKETLEKFRKEHMKCTQQETT